MQLLYYLLFPRRTGPHSYRKESHHFTVQLAVNMRKHSNVGLANEKSLVVRNGCSTITTSGDLRLCSVYYLQLNARNCFVDVMRTTNALGLLFLNSSLISEACELRISFI